MKSMRSADRNHREANGRSTREKVYLLFAKIFKIEIMWQITDGRSLLQSGVLLMIECVQCWEINSQLAISIILDIIKGKLMAEQISSKKWVDYSDEDSSDEEHQSNPQPQPQQHHPAPQSQSSNPKAKPIRPSRAEIDAQLDKLDELDDARVDQVWLLMTSSNRAYLQGEMNYLKSKAKKGGNIVSVFPSRVADGFDVKVYIKIAYDYIEKGYDSTDEMSIRVADRNFERQHNPREDRRGKQPEFKHKTSDNEKKKYVDKQTGLSPEPKKKKEEEVVDNDRKYTKEEAERKGEMLGNFRAKPKKEEEQPKNEVKIEPKVQEKPQSKTEEKPQSPPRQPEVKPAENKPKEAKKEKNDKGQKKSKPAGTKLKSQNRFEGIEDLR